ncbi:MAG: hypothetical protein HW395_552, partial [candidate division NC10 bacterium]|nr:hypothetical protein [candidate division NC10 bacterium]
MIGARGPCSTPNGFETESSADRRTRPAVTKPLPNQIVPSRAQATLGVAGTSRGNG